MPDEETKKPEPEHKPEPVSPSIIIIENGSDWVTSDTSSNSLVTKSQNPDILETKESKD